MKNMKLENRMVEAAQKYMDCVDDKQRLSVLKEYKDILKVVLDNDCTMVEFIDQPKLLEVVFLSIIESYDLQDFDDYHYWSDGCITLFEFAGITAEKC